MKNKLASAVVVAVLLTGCNHFSQGERVGVPFKFSRKGVFCKTWEGSMNLGGMRQSTSVSSDGKSTSTSMVPNTWDFTVRDGDAEKFNPIINDAIEKGETLKIIYDQNLITFCSSDNGYFVTGVKVLH